ncbi:MAG: FAD-binding oxidoreductase [Caldilineaceae bacterium]
MIQESAAVVIIGAGIVGASVAYHLAVRGCTDVVILEKAETEVTGSTAKSLAGVRHQFANEVNIRLSIYGIERLKHFHEEVGGYSGLKQVGYLLLIDDPATWAEYQRQVALQHSLGVPTELLTPAEIERRFPFTKIDGLLGATFGPNDGYCDPHGIAMGYLQRAREMGVRLLRSTPATGIKRDRDRVVAVQTPSGEIACETIVNAAGAWSGQVGALAGLGIPVLPYRRCAYMTEPFDRIPRDIPLTIDVGSGFYMRKEHDNVVFGLSNLNEPPGENFTVDWQWLNTVLDAGVVRFPILEEAGLAKNLCWAGLYEITPDHMPILGRHPQLPNYVNASGFSGHGVMHSPATGMLMAEEILDGRAHSINIDELRIDRLANKEIHAEFNVY